MNIECNARMHACARFERSSGAVKLSKDSLLDVVLLHQGRPDLRTDFEAAVRYKPCVAHYNQALSMALPTPRQNHVYF